MRRIGASAHNGSSVEPGPAGTHAVTGLRTCHFSVLKPFAGASLRYRNSCRLALHLIQDKAVRSPELELDTPLSLHLKLVDQQWNWRENQALTRWLKSAKLRHNAC